MSPCKRGSDSSALAAAATISAGAAESRRSRWAGRTSARVLASHQAFAPTPLGGARGMPSRCHAVSRSFGKSISNGKEDPSISSTRACIRAANAEPSIRASSGAALARTCPLRSSRTDSRNVSSPAPRPSAIASISSARCSAFSSFQEEARRSRAPAGSWTRSRCSNENRSEKDPSVQSRFASAGSNAVASFTPAQLQAG